MNIDEPIWTTKEGHEFYSTRDFTNSHLINIFKWLQENGTPESKWPDWLKPELKLRGLWLVCQAWADGHCPKQVGTQAPNPCGRWCWAFEFT